MLINICFPINILNKGDDTVTKHEIIWAVSSLLMVVVLLVLTLRPNQIPVFTDDNCIRAIVGEVSNENYEGMKLMAHAIRNRKTLKGVYGFKAHHIKTENRDIWMRASLAWFESLTESDPLQGANEWRSLVDLKHGHNPHNMRIVKIHNGTFYYKPLAQ